MTPLRRLAEAMQSLDDSIGYGDQEILRNFVEVQEALKELGIYRPADAERGEAPKKAGA